MAENGVWGKILAVTAGVLALIGGPGVLVINDLRSGVRDISAQLSEMKQRQVADHSFQAVAAVQQWCDAVIRELQRENATHRSYYMAQCREVIPPISIYVPPAPPWGAATLGK